MSSTNLGIGWNLSQRGLSIISRNDSIKEKDTLLQNALNADFKEVGLSVLSKELSKPRITQLVLQIQKIRNISAPKANEDSAAAPRMLKLILTDGETYAQAIETSTIHSISRDKTPPGSKILLINVPVISGFLILNADNIKLLGGKVQHLYEKWELAKSVQHCTRPTVASDGPPAWVNFGCKISASGDEFKILDSKAKDNTKENSEFESLRQGAIAEATTGAIKKVFGGGVKQVTLSNPRNDNKNKYEGGRGYNKTKRDTKISKEKEINDMPQKPSDKVSLFDFLEDKLNITENITSTNKTNVHINEYNGNHFNKFPSDNKRINNDKPFANPKINSTKREYNYNEKKYNMPKDSSMKFRKETNRNQYPNRYENSKDWSANLIDTDRSQDQFSIYKHDFKQDSRREYSFNRDQIPKNKREENKKEINSNKFENNEYPYNSNQSTLRKEYDSVKSNYTHNGMNQMKSNMDASIRNERERMNDSWHYRAPDKLNSVNSAISSVDNLVDGMQKVSMNSEFASRSLRQHLNLEMRKPAVASNPNDMNTPNVDLKRCNIGDECLAKYWEDDKFYPAKITGATENTYVVQFKGYGNIEEILKTDCMPLKSQSRGEDKKPYKGSMEFRRNPKKFAYS